MCASYQNPDGNIRVVLSSTSFSMGLDVKAVDYIIHYGPANDIDDYVQETGRAGRNFSKQCHAILIKYKRCLGSKNISKEMKEYVKTKTCRRKEILQFFGFSTELPSITKHDCCDICMKSCRCNCKCSTDECNCESSNYCNKVEPPLISAILTTEPENTNSDSSGSSTDAESPEIDSESSETDIEVQSRKPQIIYYSSDSD